MRRPQPFLLFLLSSGILLLPGLGSCTGVRSLSAHDAAAIRAERICAEVDALVRHAEDQCRALAERSAGSPQDPASIRRLQREALGADSLLQGVVAGFEPGYPADSVDACADYFFRIGKVLDHLDLTSVPVSYRTWPWYRRAEGQQEPVWTEPYIDEGGGGVAVVTCVLPIRSKKDGSVIGVQAVDVAVERFATILRRSGADEAWLKTEKGAIVATSKKVRSEEALTPPNRDARPRLMRPCGELPWTLIVCY